MMTGMEMSSMPMQEPISPIVKPVLADTFPPDSDCQVGSWYMTASDRLIQRQTNPGNPHNKLATSVATIPTFLRSIGAFLGVAGVGRAMPTPAIYY
jgi:hypothetical protein